MVTSNSEVHTTKITKMSCVRPTKSSSLNSNSSNFHLLNKDQFEEKSSISRNSVYKLKIDLMFDDTRSIPSNHLDDPLGSHRTRSIIMFGRNKLESELNKNYSSTSSYLGKSEKSMGEQNSVKDVAILNNTVQQQIEQLFTDVAEDATSSFNVTYLGSLPLKDKVTSLLGLQDPLRDLYFHELHNNRKNIGLLEICGNGLRIKLNTLSSNCYNESKSLEPTITPFRNIAVWSAVKFVISEDNTKAAFLPLITDPDNIDKSSLFHNLSTLQRNIINKYNHSPLFVVVMRAKGQPKRLMCHGFVCESSEDAIVLAATLYQSLISHVNSNSYRSNKRGQLKNRNGISCISIASSSAVTSRAYISATKSHERGQLNANCNSKAIIRTKKTLLPIQLNRTNSESYNSISSSDILNNIVEGKNEDRRRKLHKTKRVLEGSDRYTHFKNISVNELKDNSMCVHTSNYSNVAEAQKHKSRTPNCKESHIDLNGDILTRVAIPRSGSFLNTAGLTRYKSRAARRTSGKLGIGGGSPLGFSELFNEFRLQENLNSLDEILYSIIDSDGMSFNDLKPIYKEFLLKLAVTLTKDELFQRSKNIMRRQKKKKAKSHALKPQKSKHIIFGAKSLRKVLQFGRFHLCNEKSQKNSEPDVDYLSNNKKLHSRRNKFAINTSDVCMTHNDAFLGLNRNSSSGYVSCSECSYDSDTCTCVSADRCYCSLRNEHCNVSILQKFARGMLPQKNNMDPHATKRGSKNKRNSLVSCKSDEKCYCSLTEGLPQNETDNQVVSKSNTVWCDTASCASISKCYCNGRKHGQKINKSEKSKSDRSACLTRTKSSEKLALDYELFTVTGNGEPIEPEEALSVKKSVEAAAIFADVKLSQTTDIKSLCSLASLRSSKCTMSKKRCGSKYNERTYNDNKTQSITQLGRAEQCLKNTEATDKCGELNVQNDMSSQYQSMKAIDSSFENTLGYLP